MMAGLLFENNKAKRLPDLPTWSVTEKILMFESKTVPTESEYQCRLNKQNRDHPKMESSFPLNAFVNGKPVYVPSQALACSFGQQASTPLQYDGFRSCSRHILAEQQARSHQLQALSSGPPVGNVGFFRPPVSTVLGCDYTSSHSHGAAAAAAAASYCFNDANSFYFRPTSMVGVYTNTTSEDGAATLDSRFSNSSTCPLDGTSATVHEECKNSSFKYQDWQNNNHETTSYSGHSSKLSVERGDRLYPDSDSSNDSSHCRQYCSDLNDSTHSKESTSISEGEVSYERHGNSLGMKNLTGRMASGSVKRPSRALCESKCDGTGDYEYHQLSVKKFRAAEELHTTALDDAIEDSSSEDSFETYESSHNLSSCTTASDACSVLLSSLAGYEAEFTSTSACESANLPECRDRSSGCQHNDVELKQGICEQDAANYPTLFASPKEYLPFQLHPTHVDDLNEYYDLMRQKELVSWPSYCLSGQPKIRESMRHILIEWLTKISHYYNLNGSSLHLTVNVLDRYTERQKGIYRGHYQLLGVTSLLVAAKQLEVDILPVEVCLMLCRNLYTKAQLLSLERHLLDILDFDLNVPTAHTFLDYYVICSYDAVKQFSDEFESYGITNFGQENHKIPLFRRILCVSRWLLDFGLADYEFSQYLPSAAAQAAMLIATESQLDKNVEEYPNFPEDNQQRSHPRTSVGHPATKYLNRHARHDMEIERHVSTLRLLVGDENMREMRNSVESIVAKYSYE